MYTVAVFKDGLGYLYQARSDDDLKEGMLFPSGNNIEHIFSCRRETFEEAFDKAKEEARSEKFKNPRLQRLMPARKAMLSGELSVFMTSIRLELI